MNWIFTNLNKNPLRITLTLSGLLHVVGFYFLSGLTVYSPIKAPELIPIRVIALFEEEVSPPSVARATQPMRQKISARSARPVSSAHVPLIAKPVSLASIGETASALVRSDNRSRYRFSTARPRNPQSTHILAEGRELSIRPAETRIASAREGALHTSSSLVARPVAEFGSDALRNFTPAPMISQKRSSRNNASTPSVRTAALASGFVEEFLNESEIAGATDNESETPNLFSALKTGKLRQGFMKRVWNRVAEVKYYPRTARKRGFEGRPVVSFTLGNKGQLLNLNLVQPSSYTLLNEAALETIRRGTPYPPIPEPLGQNSISFKLPISYILEE
ncbi:MAG: energy transducer TonB [Nitrospinae bacterium]|nr:energy transducer TonB [Nitrospinota bacterium]